MRRRFPGQSRLLDDAPRPTDWPVDQQVGRCHCGQLRCLPPGSGSRLAVPRESVTIILNGVDLSRFWAPQEASPSKAKSSNNGHAAQRVGIVANLRPIKNIELFVRAAGRLAAAHPNACFEVAGEGESPAR